MPKINTLIDFRNEIDLINKEVLLEKGSLGTSNKDVLKKIRTSKAKEIVNLTDKLVDLALVKLINDVSSRKRKPSISGSGVDLFGEIYGIPQSLAISKNNKKDTLKLTFQEIELVIQSRETRKVNKKTEELKRLVEECRPFSRSDDDTLESALMRKQSSRKIYK